MDFFNIFSGLIRSKESEATKRRKSLRNRICRIEEVESRELLSASPYTPPDTINVGIVYHEEYRQGAIEDRAGDTFVVSWNGGAAGTTLEKIVIDLRPGNAQETMYFNIDANAPQGTNGVAYPFTILPDSDLGQGDISFALSENNQVLEITFNHFDADKVFKFKIDVNLKNSSIIMPIVPGSHFEGTSFEAVFSSDKYEQLTYKTNFIDDFNDPTLLHLSVPPDEYFEDAADSRKAMTAGVVEQVSSVQKPLAGSLSGYVYEDVNNDGIMDQGELGISGVWLELFVLGTNNMYASTGLKTQTDNNGFYLFDQIEGGRTYKVVETHPNEYADGKDTPGTIDGIMVGQAYPTDEIAAIHIGAKESGINYNFGELKRASVSGYVYEDRNNDGVRDATDQGISGVKIKLQVLNVLGTYVDVVGAVTSTDSDGKYSFDNLDPFHTYRVVEEQPNGWTDGLETVGSIAGITIGSTQQDDRIEGIVLNYNQHGIEYNFGEYKKGSISGNVYEDDNNNGIKDPGENGIDGVEIWLCVLNELGEKVNIRSTTTSNGGKYSFDDLDPGKTYCVTEVDPAGYCNNATTVGTINGQEIGSINTAMPAGWDQIHDIYIGSGDDGINYNFGENLRGSISGYVYEDIDKNGTKNVGENGIAGVVLTLWFWDGTQYIQTPRTATTDQNGYYEFDRLCPFNKYRITEAQPDGYDDGGESVGTMNGVLVGTIPANDMISEIALTPGGRGIHYNFGEIIPPQNGSLSGYVYVDANKSGTRDLNESGIAGVQIALWQRVGGGYIATGKTTTTDANGYYVFNDLNPLETYMIVETQPADYDDGAESIGSLGGVQIENDKIQGIALGDGQHGTDYNFGEWIKEIPPEPVKGSLSGSVYVDANKNGIRDANENGIANVSLTLWKRVGSNYVSTGKTTTTNSNGHYIFADLDPEETYMIVEAQPAAYDDGSETIGSLGGMQFENDKLQDIALGDGQHGTHYNFGEWIKETPPEPVKGSLSGYVYVDANKDGIRNANEKGIANVKLTLWKLVGTNYVLAGKTATTNSGGYYIFADLDPNQTYMIVQTQPADYNDGTETIGSLGGLQVENDKIQAIPLGDGQYGVNYNFGELEIPVPEPPVPPIPPQPPTPPFTPSTYMPMGAVGRMGVAGMAPVWQHPIQTDMLRPGYGGGGIPTGYSWHLSVVNAGYPRTAPVMATSSLITTVSATQQIMMLEDTNVGSEAKANEAARYVSVSWTPESMNESVWYVRDIEGGVAQRFTFGPADAIPVVADFSGDGMANLAVYHEGNWYIDINGNGTWDAEDLWCELGSTTDQPVVGDWDGDGKADIGVFGRQWSGDAVLIAEDPGLPSDLNTKIAARPKNMPPDMSLSSDTKQVRAMKHSNRGQVRLDVIDHVFQHGGEGDQALSGDFTGDGITKIGVYRNGSWYIDYNGDGVWSEGDIQIENSAQGLGAEGTAVVGDFDGDGIDNIGLFVNGIWHLDRTGDFKFDTMIEFGQVGDRPVVADFDGDGIAQLAVYRATAADSRMTMAPSVAPAKAGVQYAADASKDTEQGDMPLGEEQTSSEQGKLPEKFRRHGRTMRTPHSNAPLHRR